ncbi:MAG: PASTA domain-containing protein [Pseudomonadota bacterium]
MKKGRSPIVDGWQKRGEKDRREENKKRLIKLGVIAAFAVVFFLGWWYFSRGSAPDPVKKMEPEPERPVSSAPMKDEVKRKTIFDRNYHELAMSFNVNSIYVKPLEFDDIEKTVLQLAKALDLDEQTVLTEVKTQRSYKWLVKNITSEKASEVRDMKLAGVYFYEQEQRYYPYRQETGHIIGEVKDGHGLSGIELFYDGQLSGVSLEGGGEKQETKSRDLILSLDVKIQKLLEQEMADLLEKLRGEDAELPTRTGMSSLLMDATTGEVMAWNRLPSFADMEADGVSIEKDDKLLSGAVDPGMLSLIFKAGAAFEEDIPLDESEQGKADEIKHLVPRKMKVIHGGPAKPEWVELPDATFASEWLAGAFPEKVVTSLRDFDDYFENTGGYKLDLPESNGGEKTGISLLCRFASMINGGERVVPHFLRATITTDGQEEKWHASSEKNKVIGEKASHDLIRFLREVMPRGANVLTAELLRPLKSESPADQPEIVVLQSPVTESGKSAQKNIRCNGVVLSAIPAAAPKLVMLLIVDDARVEIENFSPFKQYATNIMEKALTLHEQKEGRRAVSVATSRDAMFQQWLRQGETIGGEENIPSVREKNLMIDLRGMSLRKALQELDRFHVKVVVEGSGAVTRQHPTKGSKVRPGSVVVLQAKQK